MLHKTKMFLTVIKKKNTKNGVLVLKLASPEDGN